MAGAEEEVETTTAHQRNPRKQFGVIADDLTGAIDTGLQFRRMGFRVSVHLGPTKPEEGEIMVLDTESRDDTSDTAYAKGSGGSSPS